MSTPDAAPIPYDFRRPNKFNRDHVHALQIVGETFARQFTTVLSTSLRAVSQVQLVSVSQLTYDEYVRETPNPTFLAALSLDPLPGTSLLHIPLEVVMAMVDRFLGGNAEGEMPARPLTEIEAGLVRNLVDRVLHELAYAFETLTPVTPTVLQLESNPQFAQITSLTDMVITLELDLKVGAHGGRASLCIPMPSMQTVLDDITAHARPATRGVLDTVAARQAVTASLDHAPVDVSVHFKPICLPSGTIVGLQPGDVVPLGHRVEIPLTVSIAGVDCFAARPGQRGRRLACLLVDPVDAADLPADPINAALHALGATLSETA